MNKTFELIRSHGTKLLGFAQITLGAIVGVSDIIPASHLKYWMVATGLLTAWRGYFNSAQSNGQT